MKNVSLINVFTTRLIDQLPPPPLKFVLFAVLVNGHGTVPLEIVVTDLHSDQEVARTLIPFAFVDPVAEHRLIFRFQNLVLPEESEFEVALFSGLDELATTRLKLKYRGDMP